MRRLSKLTDLAKVRLFQKNLPIVVAVSFFLLALDSFGPIEGYMSRICWSSTSFDKKPGVKYVDNFRTLHHKWHPKNREDRFPSIKERITLYTGGEKNGWLNKCSCYPTLQEGSLEALKEKFRKGTERPLKKDEIIDNIFDLQPEHTTDDKSVDLYLQDAREILKFVDRAKKDPDGKDIPFRAPIFTAFGDHDIQLDIAIPYFRKFSAPAATLAERDEKCENFELGAKKEKGSIQPIIWPLNTARHFSPLGVLPQMDIRWESKRNMAIWRGGANGVRETITNDNICMKYPRCRLLQMYGPNGSKYSDHVEVGYSGQINKFISEYARTKGWTSGYVNPKEILQNKAILIIEGNDVSSGLKWALYSRSVIMMPPPTLTSWLMEELLLPWVHYIPVKDDLSNVGEMMQWVIDNDNEAQKIAERATLFMHDLMYHEDAQSDTSEVLVGLAKVYLSCFGINTNILIEES